MSRKGWIIAICATVVMGILTAIKLMPLWATFLAVGSYVFGCISGYIFKSDTLKEESEISKPMVSTVETKPKSPKKVKK